MENQKIIKIGVAIFLVIICLIISYAFVQYWGHRGKIEFNIVALPEDSTIKVDGTITNAGLVYLRPGVHTLSATRQYFDEQIRRINTNDYKAGETLYILPEANSTEAKAWLTSNPEAQKQREAAGGADSAQQQRVLSKKYPFISKLPYITSSYRIDYSLTPSNDIVLTVNLFGSITGPDDYARYKKQLVDSKASAIKYMQDNGIDIQKYKVTYTPDI